MHGLQYRIQYRKGNENRAADALSRRGHVELHVVSLVVPQWLTDVQTSYSADPDAQKMLSKLSINVAVVPNFVLKDGLLRYKGRLWLGNDVQLHHRVLSALHSSPLGGHSRVPVTYRRVKKLFAWKGLKTSVQHYVNQCQTCLQAEADHAAYPGKLQPLPVPSWPWATITMDFIEGLPRSGAADCILVIVDKFTKYDHFLPLSHPYTSSSVAHCFKTHIYKLHGLPAAIVSDRDPVFTSQFWRHLFKMAGIELKLSSSCHSQTDGQTEHINQCLKTFLCCFVHACPKKWHAWLPSAEYWYNTSFHSAFGCSPFEAQLCMAVNLAH